MKNSEAIVLDMAKPWPVLPMRDSVVFPGAAMPVLLGREYSLRAVENARSGQGFVLLVLQRDLTLDDITQVDQLYGVGVIARVANLTYLPNGYAKVLAEGIMTVDLEGLHLDDGLWFAMAQPVGYTVGSEKEAEFLRQRIVAEFKEYSQRIQEVPSELLDNLLSLEHPVDAVFSLMPFVKASLEDRQRLLECKNLAQTADVLSSLIQGAIVSAGIQRSVEQDVRHRMQQNQKEWFIQEQIRLLQDEIGSPESLSPEMAELDRRIKRKKFPEVVARKVAEEFERLPNLHPSTPEYAVVRNYIDWFLNLPFGEYTEDQLNLRKVQKELDSRHYGLEKVKERILEHVAVLKLTMVEKRTPILCLVGPPGVGKTSLGRSIADAMGRKFVRITLGGVRDEAEIRGHRRTYIGSMPGRLIQALRKAQTMNPLVLLDEIDKMSSDFRGDPASAMLEVLDPEQNTEFQDHFLEVGIDLSRVLFLCTANSEDQIPGPLKDRMEVVRLSSYHRIEKHQIAQKHLIAKVCERNGVKHGTDVSITEDTIDRILDEYTREAGVRELERELDHLCRKRAMEIVSKKKFKTEITAQDLSKYLGVPRFKGNRLDQDVRHGVITGLAWTPVGGEILQLECTLLSGRGRLQLTGTLGDVMKESAQIAMTLVRERARRFGVDPEIFRKTDIHIHIPEGAIPKDGPSAGMGLTLSLLSAFTCQRISPRIAFTGEVSLTGRLHAIGGLTEKAIAALEAGATDLYLPEENRKNVSELPAAVRKGLKIHLCGHVDDVIKVLFKKPVPDKK